MKGTGIIMDKSRKIIIVLSVVSAVLAVCLIGLSAFVIMRPDNAVDKPDEASDAETSPPPETEPTKDTSSDNPQTAESGIDIHESSGEAQTTGAESDGIFQDVDEQVTAKREVNLRSSMNQGSDDNIVCVLVNGDTALRTGVGQNGWSRVVYNSQTLYCVSSYLTTDLSYTPPVETSDEFKTKFTPVNEKVTAKELTNLRDRPSVMEPSQVIAQLSNGEIAVRTGVAAEGWSRVEYNGQILYCISSYLELVEDET